MKNIATSVLLLLFAGCGEQIDETYPTYADARSAGAVERGWVPAFVPMSASDIVDSHDLDTNRQTLLFKLPSSAMSEMVTGLRRVSGDDRETLTKLIDEYGLGQGSEGYVICSEVQNGVLVVDLEHGKVVYDTTISWSDDDYL
ncbi:hypothetical protein [Erythrobacter sp.]|uniref:hypothetical protein n=1 Tax=Erythrobacter sp. TaxID=1042 RepID=UPI003C74BBAA